MAEAAEETFELKLAGDGVSIEKRVNRQVAMAIVSAVLGNGLALASPAKTPAAPASSSTSIAASPREFLTESGGKTNAEQITALGHYLCRYEGRESFSTKELKDAFRRAHETIPKNLPRDLSTAIKSGWLHEAPGKRGDYYVTNSGMQQIETQFGRKQ